MFVNSVLLSLYETLWNKWTAFGLCSLNALRYIYLTFIVGIDTKRLANTCWVYYGTGHNLGVYLWPDILCTLCISRHQNDHLYQQTPFLPLTVHVVSVSDCWLLFSITHVCSSSALIIYSTEHPGLLAFVKSVVVNDGLRDGKTHYSSYLQSLSFCHQFLQTVNLFCPEYQHLTSSWESNTDFSIIAIFILALNNWFMVFFTMWYWASTTDNNLGLCNICDTPCKLPIWFTITVADLFWIRC